MKNETLRIASRIGQVVFFGGLGSIMVWRAHSYVDPTGFTGLPQLFLCLTGFFFGFTAFSIGLGYGDPTPK